MIVNKSLYPVAANVRTINSLNSQFDKLQLQLSSGKKYNTLAEMGLDRLADLNIRTRLGRIEGYAANIQTAETRLSFYNISLTRLDEIEADVRGMALPNAYGTDGINLVTVQQQAESMLREVVDLLNTDMAGQYIFGGNASDTKPVADYAVLMNGTNVPQADGFKTVLAEYKDAHGVDDALAPGRTTIDQGPVGTVTLGQYGNAQFGIRLSGVETTGSGAIAVGGTPASGLSFAMSDDVAPLDTVTIKVTLPQDPNTTHEITLVATGEDPAGLGQFTIGADAEETAAHFETALRDALGVFAKGELSGATATQAADAFFFSPPETGVKRVEVDGGGAPQSFEGTQSTVQWYRGQVSGAGENPRQSVTVQIDEHTRAAYGVQAHEKGIAELVRSLAMLASEDMLMQPGSTDPAVQADVEKHNAGVAARYENLATTARNRLSEANNNQKGSIEGILMELGLAASSMNTVKARHTQYDAQLQTMLAEIETAPREEVVMMLLNLQTQLQASYQVTAMASQLTLVNFLR